MTIAYSVPALGNVDQRIGFVTCIEAGPLESMVVRLCESLRAFGGSVCSGNIYAVSPRLSAPLARSTRVALEGLGVTYVAKRRRHPFGWYHFLNKPLSMLAAGDTGHDDVLVWLDADTLVVREPRDMVLGADEVLGACVPCVDVIGSTGAGDPHDRWWEQLCAIGHVDLEALPIVKTHGTDRSIRFYLQAGVFGARRGSGIAESYFEMCERLLASRVVLNNGPHWFEQIALGLALVKGGYRWREWPWVVNYAVASSLPDRYERPEFDRAQILHYHDAMSPAHFPAFADRIAVSGQQQGDWLRKLGPISDPQGLLSTILDAPIKFTRKVQRRLHVRRSREL